MTKSTQAKSLSLFRHLQKLPRDFSELTDLPLEASLREVPPEELSQCQSPRLRSRMQALKDRAEIGTPQTLYEHLQVSDLGSPAPITYFEYYLHELEFFRQELTETIPNLVLERFKSQVETGDRIWLIVLLRLCDSKVKLPGWLTKAAGKALTESPQKKPRAQGKGRHSGGTEVKASEQYDAIYNYLVMEVAKALKDEQQLSFVRTYTLYDLVGEFLQLSVRALRDRCVRGKTALEPCDGRESFVWVDIDRLEHFMTRKCVKN